MTARAVRPHELVEAGLPPSPAPQELPHGLLGRVPGHHPLGHGVERLGHPRGHRPVVGPNEADLQPALAAERGPDDDDDRHGQGEHEPRAVLARQPRRGATGTGSVTGGHGA